MTDRIVYLVVTQSGGVDGRDHTDKGGHIMHATFDSREAAALTRQGWDTVKKEVVEMTRARHTALAKLNPLDKLILGIEP